MRRRGVRNPNRARPGRRDSLSRSLAAVDAFLAICQALGIGIAVGSLAGAGGVEGGARGGMTLLAAAVGLGLGALSASADDQSLLAGALPGLLGAALACPLISDIVAGAARRGGGGAPLGLMISIAALIVAGVSILVPPLALLALLALLWLAAARRRRAQRKYEGLRVLR
jgi:hypothetical protein